MAKVLVVLSDGEDNSSRTTLRHAISDAEASGVTIYAISTKDEGGAKTDADKVLQALAERSGGEALFPQDSEALHHSFDKLREHPQPLSDCLQTRNFEPNGKYRTINIIANRDGSRLQVHARKATTPGRRTRSLLAVSTPNPLLWERRLGSGHRDRVGALQPWLPPVRRLSSSVAPP